MNRKSIIAAIVLIVGVITSVFGQQHTENSSDQTLRSSGRVNPSTLGMEIDIPLGSYPGRGINVPISLQYSSKLWRMNYTSTMPVGNSDVCSENNSPIYSENAASGWTTSLAVPYIEYTGNDNTFNPQGQPTGGDAYVCQTNPPPAPAIVIIKRITLHLPGGEAHELRDETANATGSFPNSFDGTFYAADGSNIKYVQDSSTGTYRILMPDGSFYNLAANYTGLGLATIRKATKFTDRNGNFTTYNEPTTGYPNGYWTDTLGRTISVPLGLAAPTEPTTAQNPQVYSMPGMTGTYKIHWKKLKDTTAAESGLTDFSQSLKYRGDKYTTNQGGYAHIATRDPGTYLFGSDYDKWVMAINSVFNPIVLTQIELPTGQSYKFSYDVYGKIEKISYPTGGEEKFEYEVVAQLSGLDQNEDINAQTNFGVKKRQVYETAGQGTPYEWNYNAALVAPNGYKVTVTNPDNTKTERYLYRSSDTSLTFGYDTALAGMAYDERSYSSTIHLVSQKLTNWTATNLPLGQYSPAREWHPRVTSEESRIYDALGSGVSTTTAFEYEGDLTQRDTPVLMKKSSQYAFVTVGSQLPSAPVRTSETTYLINDANIAQTVRDAYRNQNMVGLVTVSKVKNGAGTIVAQSEMKYDESGYSPAYRGNPTTARVWDSTKGAVTNANAYISTRAKFDTYGNQIEAVDAKGNSTLTEYDAMYQAFPIKVTTAVPDPTGANGSSSAFITTATFDITTGLPLTTTDANGLETRIEYDAITLRPLRGKTYYSNQQVGSESETIYHDEPNNYRVKSRTQIDAVNWAESITYFDGLGRAVKIEQVDAQGNIFVEKEFDAQGRVKRATNPYRTGETKYWTTNVYDEASRIKEVVLPDASTVKTAYGVSTTGTIGITKQITDQAGKKRKGITDALGRMIRVIEDPTGQNLSTDYTFDTLGNLRKTEQGIQSRYFSYDSLGRLLRAKQPEQDVNANLALPTADAITGNNQWSVAYSYDDNGNIASTTDAKNNSVTATYDNFNRLTFRNYSDSAMPDVGFYYDGTGLGLSTIPASFKGKTTKVTSSVSETRYTSFDNLGRLLTHSQVTDGQTYSTAYIYNLSGALMEETYPSGRVVKNVLNTDGELAMVQSQRNANTGFFTYAGNIAYNSAGAVQKMRLGNGRWETAGYNERLQVTQIGLGATDADQNLLKLEYSYGTSTQNNGSLREQKITVPTVGSNAGFTAVQSYTYDDLNRLQSAAETVSNNQTWKQTFSYDRYGNRRFDTASGSTTTLNLSTAAKITNPQINTSDNRLKKDQDNDSITDYDYDANGNLTLDASGTQFMYDAENHQKQVKDAYNNPIGTYLYDGEGKRIKKISASETTVFVYNAGGKMVAEYSTQITNTPQVSYLTQDHLGSPRIITDQDGAVTNRKDYTAFGEQTFTTNRTSGLGYATNLDAVRQGYTGYEKDGESGLDYAQARYYNSAHGRFTSVDPLTASASIKNPQTFNRYSYVLNSPYKFTDPLGLLPYKSSGSGLVDRVMTGMSSNIKKDIELLQFHVANGTALGYTFLNAMQSQQHSSSLQASGPAEEAAGKAEPAGQTRNPSKKDERQPSLACNMDGICYDFVIPEEELTAIFGTPESPKNPMHSGKWDCAVLPQVLFGGTQLGTTNWWVDSGVKAFLNNDLVRGTIIATFVDGKYPGFDSGTEGYKKVNGNHVAIYWGQYKDNNGSGIIVIDQYGGEKPHYGFRKIRSQGGAVQDSPTGRSNNAQAFTIVRSLAPKFRK